MIRFARSSARDVEVLVGVLAREVGAGAERRAGAGDHARPARRRGRGVLQRRASVVGHVRAQRVEDLRAVEDHAAATPCIRGRPRGQPTERPRRARISASAACGRLGRHAGAQLGEQAGVAKPCETASSAVARTQWSVAMPHTSTSVTSCCAQPVGERCAGRRRALEARVRRGVLALEEDRVEGLRVEVGVEAPRRRCRPCSAPATSRRSRAPATSGRPGRRGGPWWRPRGRSRAPRARGRQRWSSSRDVVGHLGAPGHRQRPALAEVVLHVDDDQRALHAPRLVAAPVGARPASGGLMQPRQGFLASTHQLRGIEPRREPGASGGREAGRTELVVPGADSRGIVPAGRCWRPRPGAR